MSDHLLALLSGPVLQAAPRLLNAVLRHDTQEGTVAVRLTEVEAYDGPNDPGSHAHRGQTRRNAVMFGPPGHLYVYFTYGMHFCCNVVCGPNGTASAVLLRAGEVVEGADLAAARRRTARYLASGPARLCQALDIDRRSDGADLTRGGLTLSLGRPADRVSTGPRVGLRLAHDRPWRFWLDGDPTVSPYRPASGRRGHLDAHHSPRPR
jgi:DNA-3-methyladenine glycosylase